MANELERREFERVRLLMRAELRFADGTTARGHVRDLSMRGLFVLAPSSSAPGTPCSLRLFVGEPPNELVLEASARLVRAAPEGVALEIVELRLEDYHHLYGLSRYNAEDPAKVDAQHDAHLGLHKR